MVAKPQRNQQISQQQHQQAKQQQQLALNRAQSLELLTLPAQVNPSPPPLPAPLRLHHTRRAKLKVIEMVKII